MERVYTLIKEERLKQGMTQTDLALAVGYKGKSMIAKVEKGLVDLPLPMVTKFAEALHVTESYLMGWEENPEDVKARLTEAYIKGNRVARLSKDEKVMKYAEYLMDMSEESRQQAFNFVDLLLLKESQNKG